MMTRSAWGDVAQYSHTLFRASLLRHRVRWLTLFLCAALAGCACTHSAGDDDIPHGRQLSDCEYATSAQKLFDRVHHGVGLAAEQMTAGHASDNDRDQMRDA